MNCLQTAKTSNLKESSDGIITFIDENDRTKFCHLLSNLLESDKFKKRIAKRIARNRSFIIKCNIPEFSEINLIQTFFIKFKKVRKMPHEYDLDIKIDKMKDIPLEEVFDVTLT